jgi:hypothetical protein
MITIAKTGDAVTPSLARIQNQLEQLPDQAFEVWREATPVRTGNARRRTRLQGDVIRADYDYAVPLDRGSSRRAPEGMSRPTERFLRQALARIMRP